MREVREEEGREESARGIILASRNHYRCRLSHRSPDPDFLFRFLCFPHSISLSLSLSLSLTRALCSFFLCVGPSRSSRRSSRAASIMLDEFDHYTPPLEGFLMKKGLKGLSKGWKRRWFAFSIEELRLYYYKRSASEAPRGWIDLQTFSVHSDNADKCHFEIKTPARIYFLQAESEEEAVYWVQGLLNIECERQQLAKSMPDGLDMLEPASPRDPDRDGTINDGGGGGGGGDGDSSTPYRIVSFDQQHQPPQQRQLLEQQQQLRLRLPQQQQQQQQQQHDDVAELRAALEQAHRELEQKQDEIDSLSDEMREALRVVTGKGEHISMLQSKILEQEEHFESTVSALKKERATLAAELASLRAQMRDSTQQLAEQCAAIASAANHQHGQPTDENLVRQLTSRLAERDLAIRDKDRAIQAHLCEIASLKEELEQASEQLKDQVERRQVTNRLIDAIVEARTNCQRHYTGRDANALRDEDMRTLVMVIDALSNLYEQQRIGVKLAPSSVDEQLAVVRQKLRATPRARQPDKRGTLHLLRSAFNISQPPSNAPAPTVPSSRTSTVFTTSPPPPTTITTSASAAVISPRRTPATVMTTPIVEPSTPPQTQPLADPTPTTPSSAPSAPSSTPPPSSQPPSLSPTPSLSSSASAVSCIPVEIPQPTLPSDRTPPIPAQIDAHLLSRSPSSPPPPPPTKSTTAPPAVDVSLSTSGAM